MNDVRIKKGHHYLGKYVVEVSNEFDTEEQAYDLMLKLNSMVFRRVGIVDRFKTMFNGRSYLVMRKLLVGDSIEFITECKPLLEGIGV